MRFPLLLAVAGFLLAPLVSSAPAVAGAAAVHAPVRVPNVVGKSRPVTFAAMRKAGLYFSTTGPGSSNGSWTRVLSEHPKAGTLVAYHSSVSLKVTQATTTTTSASTRSKARVSSSTGPVKVPNLTHMTRKQVFAVMRRAGLYFSTSGAGSSDGTWRSVVKESPRAGTVVAHLSSVSLTTSVQAPIARGLVRVPNLINRTKSQVYTLMRRADLYFTTSGGGTNWSRVVSQVPKAGTPVHKKASVRLGTVAPKPVTTAASSTSTVPAANPSHSVIGIATWYNYIPGRCATSYLPFGTRITIRDLSSGVTISCVVTDRQEKAPGRVVDLSETQFSELAPLWRGVVRVKVSW